MKNQQLTILGFALVSTVLSPVLFYFTSLKLDRITGEISRELERIDSKQLEIIKDNDAMFKIEIDEGLMDDIFKNKIQKKEPTNNELPKASGESAKKKLAKFIKEKEGFKSTWYTCSGGARTIGYGFTQNGVETAVRYGFLKKGYKLPNKMTEKEASLFVEEVVVPTFVKAVEQRLKVEIKDNQKMALASFAYNLGESNLENILKDVNEKKDPTKRMSLYVKVKTKKGVKTLNGLKKRRDQEIAMWKGDF